jgi:hypothetical protein
MWYVENYGLLLSTVKRNRKLLDHPALLQMKLLSQGGPLVNLQKFCAYWKGRSEKEFNA